MQIQYDSREAFRRMFDAVDRKAREGIDEAAEEIGRDFFQQIMQRQPKWTGDDPLRNERPSVRQGLVPIHQGWMGGPRIEHVQPDSVDIVLKSRSQHVQYFTSVMGKRQWLGTRHQRGVWAGKNYDTLRFWFLGREFRAKAVDHRGFRVAEDFVALARDSILPQANQKVGDTMRVALLSSAKEVV